MPADAPKRSGAVAPNPVAIQVAAHFLTVIVRQFLLHVRVIDLFADLSDSVGHFDKDHDKEANSITFLSYFNTMSSRPVDQACQRPLRRPRRWAHRDYTDAPTGNRWCSNASWGQHSERIPGRLRREFQIAEIGPQSKANT